MHVLADTPEADAWLFMASGFSTLAPELADKYDALRRQSDKPICLTWQSMPKGLAEDLAARGIYAFTEHARAVRTLGHLVRHAEHLRTPVRRVASTGEPFPWSRYVDADNGASQVISENVVARILEDAGLPVARGRIATTEAEAVAAAGEVGFPVAIKGISAAITHRAAAGLVALNIDSAQAVVDTDRLFRERAAARGVTLDGTWIQHMFAGSQELLVTALRDREFGVMIGCGMGGGMTEIIDDVSFTRGPIDEDGAYNLIGTIRTLRRLPHLLDETQRREAARFVAQFSVLVASAPWDAFTFEINPLKIGERSVAAVDGLLLVG
jgi:acyl-CoA synthetase (NDP forming)